MSECEVCGGGGYYPIFNIEGRELYQIRCPECDGVTLDESATSVPAEVTK